MQTHMEVQPASLAGRPFIDESFANQGAMSYSDLDEWRPGISPSLFRLESPKRS